MKQHDEYLKTRLRQRTNVEQLLALLSAQIGERVAEHEADGGEEVALARAIAPDCVEEGMSSA